VFPVEIRVAPPTQALFFHRQRAAGTSTREPIPSNGIYLRSYRVRPLARYTDRRGTQDRCQAELTFAIHEPLKPLAAKKNKP